jgi:hypothetical protein
MCVVFPVLALLAVCLRFYVRLKTKRAPWVDDYAVLISVLLTAAYAGLTIARECACCALDIENLEVSNERRNSMGNGTEPDLFP